MKRKPRRGRKSNPEFFGLTNQALTVTLTLAGLAAAGLVVYRIVKSQKEKEQALALAKANAVPASVATAVMTVADLIKAKKKKKKK